jgi:hypothetical protein
MRLLIFKGGVQNLKEKIIFGLIVLFLFSSESFATEFGVGIHGGKDFYSISNLKTGFRLLDLTEASVSRDGFANPWVVGVSFSFKINRNWKMRINGDVVLVKYEVLFTRNYPTLYDPFYIKTSEYKIDWGRAAILGTVERDWQISDHFYVFGGTGGGLYILAPVVSDKFLVNTLLDKFMELDISKDIEMSYKLGAHALLGLEAVTFSDKVSFRIEGRYSFMSEGKYEEPTRFFSVFSGIIFNFKL